MKNILIFGASTVHGTGGENGGWADKVKASLYKDMYGPGGQGPACEVYELGIPGGTLADILERFLSELQARVNGTNPQDTIIVFSAGTNDSRAEHSSNSYPFSPDDFAANVHSFIHLAKDYSTYIVGVGLAPVDEAKTNPFSNSKNFYTNQRLQAFDEAFQRTCEAEGAYFVPIFNQVPSTWLQDYVYTDGAHPNNAGHEWIQAQVEPQLRKLLGWSA